MSQPSIFTQSAFGASNSLEAACLNSQRGAFDRLDAYSAEIGHAARNLSTRLLSRDRFPRAGVMLPALLDQALCLDRDAAQRLGTTWFLLYLYTLVIDAQMDEEYQASPAELMATAAMFDSGLSDLRRQVHGTQYESIVDDCVRTALSGQLRDRSSRTTVRKLCAAEQDTKDKNAYVIALAAAYASQVDSGLAVIRFASNLVLALQYLDDIADRLADFQQGNFTYLLACADEVQHLTAVRSEEELLEVLIRTGALARTLDGTISALEEARTSTSEFPAGPFRLQLQNYLHDLLVQVRDTEELAARHKDYVQVHGRYPPELRAGLQRSLRKIAFST